MTLAKFKFAYPDIAWSTTRNLLLVCGSIGVFVFFTTLHWLLVLPSLFFLAGLWYCLYRFEIGYRTRRLAEFRYNYDGRMTILKALEEESKDASFLH